MSSEPDRPRRHFGDSPTGPGWYAYPPTDYVEPAESYEVEGNVIRFEPEDTVRVPLWDESGLLPEEPDWLNRALGLGPGLVADLAAWGDDWNAPRPGLTNEQHFERDQRLASEARALIERLRDELPEGYTIAHGF